MFCYSLKEFNSSFITHIVQWITIFQTALNGLTFVTVISLQQITYLHRISGKWCYECFWFWYNWQICYDWHTFKWCSQRLCSSNLIKYVKYKIFDIRSMWYMTSFRLKTLLKISNHFTEDWVCYTGCTYQSFTYDTEEWRYPLVFNDVIRMFLIY